MTACNCVEDVVCRACMTSVEPPALSTPPADDVREALAWVEKTLALPVYESPLPDSYGEGVRDALRTVERLLRREVRPRGTVTDADQWTDRQLDAAYKAFRAHERGSEFNEFGEHVCSECGYAYSWPEGNPLRQRVHPRRSSRHIARAALEAAREVHS